jgi:hypothetical protein
MPRAVSPRPRPGLTRVPARRRPPALRRGVVAVELVVLRSPRRRVVQVAHVGAAVAEEADAARALHPRRLLTRPGGLQLRPARAKKPGRK